jgi:type III pantothenate kinase
MVLCDIGNSTYNFKLKNKQFKVDVDNDLENINLENKKLYYISVNSKATKKLIQKYPNAIDIKKIFEYKTKYVGMGIDRQVVCNFVKNAIIVDLGSAITVDIIQENIHLGGFIIPGLQSFKKIYPRISRNLTFKFRNDIDLAKIPLNTQDAISYAILSAIILPIKKVQKQYNLPLIFTGGDSQQILKYFKKENYRYDKNLIFKSMKKIIQNNKKGNK